MRTSSIWIAMTPSISPLTRRTSAGLPLTTVGSLLSATWALPRPPTMKAGHLLGAGDRPRRGLLDAAAVGDEDDLGGEERVHCRPRLAATDTGSHAGATSPVGWAAAALHPRGGRADQRTGRSDGLSGPVRNREAPITRPHLA